MVLVRTGRYIDAESVYLNASVTVKNEGGQAGSEVVQLYVSLPEIGVTTPKLQLRGFAKARLLKPGGSTKLTINLDKYAFSFWDESQNAWKLPAGKYGIHLGTSSDNLVLHDTFELPRSFIWNGL